MKRYLSIVALALLLTLVFATSCRDDIFLEPLPTLEGIYDGTYSVITGRNTQNEEITTSTIEMRFSDKLYWFDDDLSPDNFCSPRGSYILSNNIEITETQPGCNVTANENDNPIGGFSIRRPGDSVIMLQQTDDILKQILLLRR